MAETDRVDLAHEPDFLLGRLAVAPSRRELVRDDGERAVLEHRVMQVLVALARAQGGIVTRDELTRSCWDGRIVGEDAINRVVSLLRRAAEGVGAGSFGIKTITKIGYRLVGPAGASVPVVAASHRRWPSRRTFAFGAAAVGVVAIAGGGALLYGSASNSGAPSEIEPLLTQAWQAWTQGTREGNSQAVGLYRRVTVLAPDYPDGWGLLGCAYADTSHFRPRAEAEALRERARAAGRRALELDPRNAYGRAALTYARPLRGNWLSMETEFRRALADQPDRRLVMHGIGLSLCRVGRFTEAATYFARIAGNPLAPFQYLFHILALWGAGRIEEAEHLLAEAASIYPTHASIWFTRFDMLLFGGRPSAALAMAEDADGHPSGVPASQIQERAAVARAMRSRDPAEADRVMAVQLQHAREGTFGAVDAIQFASALGRVDEAFAVADAYQFSRGFIVPDAENAPVQHSDPMLEDRQTIFLFLPPTRTMREDRRFARLVEELGLERYWREAGVQPDYRQS